MNQEILKDPTKIQKLVEQYQASLMDYLPTLALALVVLVVGFWLSGRFSHAFDKFMTKKGFDVSLIQFLSSLMNWTLRIMVGIAVIEMIGVETTSFVAILGAAGLAVGLALQGSLSNFAGGVLILIFKPFKTGDYIIAQGEEGTVQKIDIFNTWLNKFDNRRVILPNGPLASGVMVNVTAEEQRRVDIAVGVSYSADIDETRKVLIEMVKKDPRVLSEPEPFMPLTAMADSSVNFSLRVWCKSEDFWPLYFDLNERVKKTLDANKISIPFPQRDVHLFKHD